MRYLIIDAQYRIYQTDFFSGYVRSQARAGKLSVVRLRDMKGFNTAAYADENNEEWSDIQGLPQGFKVD